MKGAEGLQYVESGINVVILETIAGVPVYMFIDMILAWLLAGTLDIAHAVKHEAGTWGGYPAHKSSFW